MANSSLDLSDRAVLGSLARLLARVRRVAGDTPVLLVGATARDLLLVHGHGVEGQRATEDTDLALAVANWEAFLRLREALVTWGGFTVDAPPHRLWFGDQRLDIIPFGGVERPDRSIAWPTEGAEVMNVAGLTESLATAVAVRLPGGVSIDVAPLPALDAVLRPEIDPDGTLGLVAQMPPGDRERQVSLLAAFWAGLFEAGIEPGR